jgi:translation initiation factor 4E
MWEDEHCKSGGRWSIRVPKTHTNKYWEDLILALIGEQFTLENEILGLVIALRPSQDTISVWVRNGEVQEKIEKVKEDIEMFIKIDESLGIKIDYESFAEALKKKAEY